MGLWRGKYFGFFGRVYCHADLLFFWFGDCLVFLVWGSFRFFFGLKRVLFFYLSFSFLVWGGFSF